MVDGSSVPDRALAALLEQEYAAQRKQAAEDLYNALTDVFNEQRPSIETALYVLDALRTSILQRDVAKNTAPPAKKGAPVEEESVALSPARPASPGKVGWRGERARRDGQG